MVANRFATMLHRKTNKITLVLVYAVLEWILIYLLLWNSLFSYLITKFAEYFGLKRPCLFCSRIDHLFDPAKKAHSYRDLLCGGHASEISKLGFCSCHGKVVESKDMCDACSSSGEFSKEFAYFPWMKQIGKVRSGFEDSNTVSENGGVDVKCSCCGAIVEKKLYSPCLLIKPDWGILDFSHKRKMIEEGYITEKIQIPCEPTSFDSVTEIDDEQKRKGCRASDHAERENNAEEIKINCKTDKVIKFPTYQIRSDTVCEEDRIGDRSEETRKLSDTDGKKEDEGEEEFSCFISSFDCNQGAVDEKEAAETVAVPATAAGEANKQSDSNCQVNFMEDDEEWCKGNDANPQMNAAEVDQEASKQSDANVPMNAAEGDQEAYELNDANVHMNATQNYREASTRNDSNFQMNAAEGDKETSNQYEMNILVNPTEDVQGTCKQSDATLQMKATEDDQEARKQNDAKIQMNSSEDDQEMSGRTDATIQINATEDDQETSRPNGASIQMNAAESYQEVGKQNGASSQMITVEDYQEASKQSHVSVQINDSERCGKAENLVQDIPPKHLEFLVDRQDYQLIPIDFYKSGNENYGSNDNGDVILDFNVQVGTQVDFVVEKRQGFKGKSSFFSLGQIKEEDEEDVADDEIDAEADKDVDAGLQIAQASPNDILQLSSDEADGEVSIGTEIPEYEQIEDFPAQEPAPECSVLLVGGDDQDLSGFKQDEDMLEFNVVPVDAKTRAVNMIASELEIEEERVPDDPCSVGYPQEWCSPGAEDFLDNISVTSEFECTDGVLTMEELKSALKDERQALQGLYAELEEERSAAAVAASQTLAMINRLHEEKAAMQMEALQYQRMMEEQSEYDQEALQLLNELMIKKDKERVELEKELDLYKKKVAEYEARERASLLRWRTSSASNEDSDGLSLDQSQELREEVKEKKNFCDDQIPHEHERTPADAVLYLEGSLADFEVERLSIIEQLRALEEKLITLNVDDTEFSDVKADENGNGHVEDSNATSGNLHSKELGGKHCLVNAKTLLPLFDAADTETEDVSSNGDSHTNGFVPVCSKPGTGNQIYHVEEEVDELYDRLEALEADREFLKHCVSSLRKGDKGIYLLQEILQHLRDLRRVEAQTKKMESAAFHVWEQNNQSFGTRQH